MERCKDCELAIYCFSDSSSWIFRTTQEMEEKKHAIYNCPVRDQVTKARAGRTATVTRQTVEEDKRS